MCREEPGNEAIDGCSIQCYAVFLMYKDKLHVLLVYSDQNVQQLVERCQHIHGFPQCHVLGMISLTPQM